MSRMMLFSVHDSKTDAFAPPYTASTPGEAERRFRTACSEEGDLKRYPTDFNLYQVGFFNNVAGLVESVVPPVFVCSALVELNEVRRAS